MPINAVLMIISPRYGKKRFLAAAGYMFWGLWSLFELIGLKLLATVCTITWCILMGSFLFLIIRSGEFIPKKRPVSDVL
jgi:hypothetical protein